MKLKFVKFNVIGKDGRRTEMPINPQTVCMIMPIIIDSEINGPDGSPLGKPAAALDFGTNAVPVDCTVEEAQTKLENVKAII